MFGNDGQSFSPKDAEEFLAQSSQPILDGIHALVEVIDNYPNLTTLFFAFNALVLFICLHSRIKQTTQLQLALQQEKQQRRDQKKQAVDKIASLLEAIASAFKTQIEIQLEMHKQSLTLLKALQEDLFNQQETRETDKQSTHKVNQEISVKLERILHNIFTLQDALKEEDTLSSLQQLNISAPDPQPTLLLSQPTAPQAKNLEGESTTQDLDNPRKNRVKSALS